MRHTFAALRLTAVAAFAVAMTGCGGGGDGDQSSHAGYGKAVIFGDSLSDVGSYKVSTLSAVGGGRYTVNSGGGENWTELVSRQLGLAAPCAAVTGLSSAGPLAAVVPPVARAAHAGCFSYAQGGARVSDPNGPGNAAFPASDGSALGQLTEPVVTQIANHLAAVGGTFSGSDIVFVMAGGNDAIINLTTFAATVTASPTSAATAASAAVTNLATAGAQLANAISTQIVAKGAQRVVVVNIPDLANTPTGVAAGSAQPVVAQMVSAFNTALASGLTSVGGKVLLVDAYTVNHDQITNPAQYALTNVTTPACDLNNAAGRTAPGAVLLSQLKTSLVCTSATTLANLDVSRYLFADTVHPTPYGYRLLAQLVTDRMAKAGWL